MNYLNININGYNVQVNFTDRCAHVLNDATLKNMLSGTQGGSLKLASAIKSTYNHYMLKPLNIDTRSIALEILGHVYPDRFLNAIISLPIPSSIKNACQSVADHTAVIDSGESTVDSNRFVWDGMVFCFDAIQTVIC